MIELQSQIQAIFKSIPEAIFVVKEDLTCIMKNYAAELLIMETSDTFLHETSLTFKDDTQTSLANIVTEVISKGLSSNQMLGKSKTREKTFEWKVSLAAWEGQPVVTLLMQDVTAIINLEQKRYRTAIRQIMLRLVSHELKTPVNAFTNCLKKALLCQELPSAAKFLIELAQDSCQQILQVINDLLDYSQFLHGSFQLSKQEFDIRQTLMSSFKPYDYMFKAAGVTALIKIDNKLPTLAFSDPVRISQVIMNLLSNAAKFTRRGQIVLSADVTEPNSLTISVSDTGVGMSQDTQAKLRSLFSRLMGNVRLNLEGSGLGLHIANLLTIQLGGASIEFQSTQGEGATFSFRVKLGEEGDNLPADCSTSLDEIKGVRPPVFKFPNPILHSKVLIVDDCLFNRDVMAAILGEMGVKYYAVASGFDAIQAISSQTFMLMFIDYEMPNLNGAQTCRILKQMQMRGELKSLPTIIAYTAFPSEREVQECKDAGIEEILDKPCRADEFRQLVRKYSQVALE
jgi:signal transduction histidine kinase